MKLYIIAEIDTGDIVFKTEVTQGGSIIRLFDHAEFSHAVIAIRDPSITDICIWGIWKFWQYSCVYKYVLYVELYGGT